MYVITIGLLWLLAFRQSLSSNKALSQRLILLCFILLVIHDGLRWETGTDWNYYDAFLGRTESAHFEIGYRMLQNFVAAITHNYSVFLILHAVCIYSLYFYWLKKFIPLGFFTALLLFYVSMIGFLGMNRQHIALAFCLVSSTFWVEKKYSIFVVLNLIAISFHNSAIMFMPITWLATRNIPIKYYFVAMFAALIVNHLGFVTPIYTWLTNLMGGNIAEKNEFYLTYEANRTTLSFLLFTTRRMIVLLFIWLLKNRLPWDNPYLKYAFSIYLVSLVLSFAFDGELQFLQGRFTLYFLIFEAVLWGYVAWYAPNYYKPPLMTLILAYSIISFYRSIDLYPDLFLPYQSVFSEQQRRIL